MASQLKVDQLLNGSGGTFDGSQLGKVGKVLQTKSIANNTYLATTSTSWIDTGISFSIDNVQLNSKIEIEAHIHHLIENSGSGGFRIVKVSNGNVLATSQHSTNGNGGWRAILPSLIGVDTTPSIGTNTYKIQMASTGMTIYINYWNTTHFGASSFFRMIEIGA